jgi:hypothetical protein
MKNEVKKKMHEVQRASLHQSHAQTSAKRKISTSLHRNPSRASHRKGERDAIDLARGCPS